MFIDTLIMNLFAPFQNDEEAEDENTDEISVKEEEIKEIVNSNVEEKKDETKNDEKESKIDDVGDSSNHADHEDSLHLTIGEEDEKMLEVRNILDTMYV